MIRKPVFCSEQFLFFYKKKIFWNFLKHGHDGQAFDNQNKREKTIMFQYCLQGFENCIVCFLCSLEAWPIQYFVDKDDSAISYLKLCHAYAFKMSHEEHFQIVIKEIAFKKAFPVYFQPMCDLIIANVLLICPVDPSPKRKNGSVVLCHTLTTKYTLVPMPKQNKEKSFFFQRMKANKFVYLQCMFIWTIEQWHFWSAINNYYSHLRFEFWVLYINIQNGRFIREILSLAQRKKHVWKRCKYSICTLENGKHDLEINMKYYNTIWSDYIIKVWGRGQREFSIPGILDESASFFLARPREMIF